MTTGVLDRLFQRVEETPEGCWVWTGARLPTGYGRVMLNGKNRSTHRVVYELMVAPIPTGLVLDHLCRTTSCLRPDHLEPVRQRENLRRGRTHWGLIEATGKCQRGHDYEANAIQRGQWRGCGACIAEREAKRVRIRPVPDTCPKGHQKVPRSNGRLYCPPCFKDSLKRRKGVAA